MADDRIRKTAEEVWQEVKPYILPYYGGASQIYVLDIPTSELHRVFRHLDQISVSCELDMLDGHTFEQGHKIDPKDSRIFEVLNASNPSMLRCTLQGGELLQIYVWPSTQAHLRDIEIVFFACDFFPDGKSEASNLNAFLQIYELTETVRLNAPDSTCIFASSEVGDPRNGGIRDAAW